MTQSSDVERHLKALRDTLAAEKASGVPVDTSWSDDLPSDPLPSEGEETSVTFVKKAGPPSPAEILKWDRNQPRNPAGSKEGGRWAKGVSQGLGTVWGSIDSGSIPLGMERGGGSADYRDILNAPMGTGFGNTPRVTGDPEMVQRLTVVTPAPGSNPLKAMQTANVAISDQLDPGGHVNAAYLVTLDDADATKAVLKPENGERWTGAFANGEITSHITNRQFSLAEREAMAYEVDTALGLGLVPPTVHRENIDGIDLGDIEKPESGYDPDEVQGMYDQYREKAQENAYDVVGGEMGDLFEEAKNEHLSDINDRHDEMVDIWNDLIDKEFPETEHVDLEAQREHPNLPLGEGQIPFERRVPESVDPLTLLNEAEVDVSRSFNAKTEETVRALLRSKLEEGVLTLGDVDEDAAKDDLNWDNWLESHADTENRLLNEKIQSFDAWKQEHGFSSGGGRGGGVPNEDAPHPGGGSLQKFVSGLTNWGHMTPEETRKFAVLDYVIGSMDRHGMNVSFDADGRAVAIDNGYAFPSSSSDNPHNFQYRSAPVLDWRSASKSATHMSTEEREPIESAIANTDWQSLVDRHPNMSARERAALLGRVAIMRDALRTNDGLIKLWQRVPIDY